MRKIGFCTITEKNLRGRDILYKNYFNCAGNSMITKLTLYIVWVLFRSNISQQKITALNSMANLLSLETSGIYDNIIDIPMEQVFFILRFCLDDNAPFALNASIKAMRNLFYYPIDEACLDSLLGFGTGMIQPTLLSEEHDKEDDNTINDQQLAEMNLVKCLLRTDVLTRIGSGSI